MPESTEPDARVGEYEYPARPIDYETRRRDPASWHSVGLSLYVAADALWRQLHPALQAWSSNEALSREHEIALRLRGPFAMLAGMAIEVWLKGAIVVAMPPSERTSPPLGHNLVALSDTAGMSWNEREIDLLNRLTTFVRWAGRYPVGLNVEATQEPRILKSSDYLTIIGIARHLHDVLGRRTV